jgi:hypothetical protein
MIGYVPRYFARDIWNLLMACPPDIKILVERLNKDAPLRQRLLCRMHGCWPEGFLPCNDDAFHPIPEQMTANCEDSFVDDPP